MEVTESTIKGWMDIKVLQGLADAVAEPLSKIYQKSGESGNTSIDWEPANIISSSKNSLRDVPGKYRPVSLTSVAGKVMEYIIPGDTEKQL